MSEKVVNLAGREGGMAGDRRRVRPEFSDQLVGMITTDELSPQAIRRILRERATALAKPLVQGQTATETLDLLVFALAGERYGIEVTSICEIIRLRGLTKVPCMPPVVTGVINHRGRIIAVLDLLQLLNQPHNPAAERSWVVVVEGAAMTCGLLASAEVQVISWKTHELGSLPASRTEAHLGFIRGVTEETVFVLDPEALARVVEVMITDTVS